MEKVEYFKGPGPLKRQNAQPPISEHRDVIRSIGAYPNSVGVLADTVVGFLVNDSNRNMILQQCECNDEPGWPTTSLVHPSMLALSVPQKAHEAYHEYRCSRSRHGSAKRVENCVVDYLHTAGYRTL